MSRKLIENRLCPITGLTKTEAYFLKPHGVDKTALVLVLFAKTINAQDKSRTTGLKNHNQLRGRQLSVPIFYPENLASQYLSVMNSKSNLQGRDQLGKFVSFVGERISAKYFPHLGFTSMISSGNCIAFAFIASKPVVFTSAGFILLSLALEKFT